MTFLKSFKGEITQSKTYKTLLAYYEKRLINKTIVLPQLTDDKGKRLNILDSKYDKHFVIFGQAGVLLVVMRFHY